MGLATAKIVGRDHAVVICDVSQDQLNAAAAQLADADIECTAVVCDITDKKSVAELVATASTVGTIASVIHTAEVDASMGAADSSCGSTRWGRYQDVDETLLPLARDGFAIVNVT